jgi:SAM-dependent methyltransferase
MSFVVSADAYGQFMGRFSTPLAGEFVAEFDLQDGMRVVDVGSGPGMLTALLIDRLGVDNVVAADPSEPFVLALRERFPGLEAHLAPAESLPIPDDTVDVAAAQLVVQFMTDPVAGIGEMCRVTRAGGLVAACVWDDQNDRSPLSYYWRAVRELDPDHAGERGRVGTKEGDLGEIFRAAGLRDVRDATVTARVPISSFDEYWAPFQLGVGPPGAHLASLNATDAAQLRNVCESLFPATPAVLAVTAWAAYGRVVEQQS